MLILLDDDMILRIRPHLTKDFDNLAGHFATSAGFCAVISEFWSGDVRPALITGHYNGVRRSRMLGSFGTSVPRWVQVTTFT